MAVFLLSTWALGFYASRVLRAEMEMVLGEAQFSTVSYVAAAINSELEERLRALTSVAETISPDLLARPADLNEFLAKRPVFQAMFNAGTFVTRTAGIIIVAQPSSLPRLGVDVSDREHIVAALKDGKATIGKPRIGAVLKSPLFVMTAPIRDASGTVIGTLSGVTDLGQPNFFDKFTSSHYGKTGGYLLVAPQHGLIVTATAKNRVMAALPPPSPAVKGSTSRFIAGYEGYDVVVNQLGVEVLAAAKSVPVAGWYVAASLPTTEAFAPVEIMHSRILLAALLLSGLAGTLTWWLLNSQFAGLRVATQSLSRMAEPGQLLAPIPVAGNDEVGVLVGGFNRLLASLSAQEAILRASEANFRRLAESMPQIIWVAGADGRFEYFNPQWGAYTGLDLEQSYGNGWLQPFHPDDQPALWAAWQDALSGKMLFSVECRLRRVDGDYRWWLMRGVPVRTATGTIDQWFGTCTDIEENKQAEHKLRGAYSAAEFANNAKSRFLAAASHDLRQPLAALSLYTDALKCQVAPSQQPLVTSMNNCIVSLSGLLNDLLDLSKLEAGVVKPCITDFSVSKLLVSLESVYLLKAQAKGLSLRFVTSSLTGRGDSILFKRLLGNFIDNAIRYTPHGGIVVGCRRRQGKTWIEVWDTGIGIPANRTTEIFEEFKQLGDQARNQGSGLGLAIVAKTAAMLGLAISVRSRPGQGSVFAVELPLGKSELVMPEGASHAASSRPLRIAFVEDNPMVLDAMVTCLQGLGHEVVATASQTALLTELKKFVPDIVVSDYRLRQGETGIDVITAVRTQLGTELPAILITGDTDPNLLRSISDRGIVVLHKPVDLNTLQAYLEDLTYQRD